MISFVLVNSSTVTDSAYGGELTPAIMALIAAATLSQLNNEYSREWGGGFAVRVDGLDGVHEGECGVNIADTIPVPGAAGYHDRLPNGAPVIYVARSSATSLTTGPGALSVTISHELLETAGDPAVNRWVDRGDGTEEALEMCDRVEDQAYCPGSVWLSDFLRQAAFDPWAPGPYSFLGSIAHPLDMTPGGYCLLRSVAADEHAVTPRLGPGVHVAGSRSAARLEKHAHPSSRAYKRGLRA